jgi:hypothetical protein
MANSNIIRVPKPVRRSFNPKRLVAKNSLLTNQIQHFRKLEKEMPQELQTGIDFASIKTEGEASEYIRKMTAILHPRAAKGGGGR